MQVIFDIMHKKISYGIMIDFLSLISFSLYENYIQKIKMVITPSIQISFSPIIYQLKGISRPLIWLKVHLNENVIRKSLNICESIKHWKQLI